MAKKDKKKKKNFQEKIYKGQIDPNLDEVADYWKVLFTVLPFGNFVKCWIIEFLARESDVATSLHIYISIWNYTACNLINFPNYPNKMDSLYRPCLNPFVALHGLSIIHRLAWRAYLCVDLHQVKIIGSNKTRYCAIFSELTTIPKWAVKV